MKIIFILLGIVAFWEAIITIVLSRVGQLPPVVMAIIDTVSLTLLLAPSIWFLIIIPEKKRAQKVFSRSIHLLDQENQAFDQIGIVSATDTNGKIIYANDNFCKISGYSRKELIGQDHRILNSGFHPKEFFKLMWSTINAGKTWRGAIRNKNKNGEFYWVDCYIIPIFDNENKLCKYLSFRFDITAEKLAEEALEQEKIKSIHLGRLSAIGEMAAGIAHEINNPLSIIHALLSVIKRKLHSSNLEEDMPKILDNIDKTQSQIIRMTKIISGLIEFSRSGENRPFEKVSAKKLFESVENLCSEKLNRLGIRFEVQQDEVEFQCNPIQIEQVLVNLINNSIDAILPLADKWIRMEAVLLGEFVEISVTDSGQGITQEMAQKIMQPFFTTKGVGKGAGLGLSISRGIIEHHGGIFNVDHSSKNTRFVIQIPLYEAALLDLIDIEEVIKGHLAWRYKILRLVSNPLSCIDCEEVGSDGHCSAGKWIERIEPRFKQNPHFIELKTAHKEFHKCAGEIVRRILEGDQIISELTLGSDSEYDKLSKRVVSALQNIRFAFSSGSATEKNH